MEALQTYLLPVQCSKRQNVALPLSAASHQDETYSLALLTWKTHSAVNSTSGHGPRLLTLIDERT